MLLSTIPTSFEASFDHHGLTGKIWLYHPPHGPQPIGYVAARLGALGALGALLAATAGLGWLFIAETYSAITRGELVLGMVCWILAVVGVGSFTSLLRVPHALKVTSHTLTIGIVSLETSKFRGARLADTLPRSLVIETSDNTHTLLVSDKHPDEDLEWLAAVLQVLARSQSQQRSAAVPASLRELLQTAGLASGRSTRRWLDHY